MSLMIIKLWISSYIYNYLLIIKCLLTINYLYYYICGLIPISIISYIDCNIFNFLLSILSILDIEEYIPNNCISHMYIYTHIEHIYKTFTYIPKLFIKQYFRPFHNLDEIMWNQLLLEWI